MISAPALPRFTSLRAPPDPFGTLCGGRSLQSPALCRPGVRAALRQVRLNNRLRMEVLAILAEVLRVLMGRPG